MVSIRNATFDVYLVPEHPGRRLLVVEFDLDMGPDEDQGELMEAVVVHAVDLGDAPVAPHDPLIELLRRPSVDGPPTRRRFERQVARVALDVEQDWWRSGQGGEVEPLSEFVDHLAAEITIREVGPVVATARTPLVSGSWGALGAD